MRDISACRSSVDTVSAWPQRGSAPESCRVLYTGYVSHLLFRAARSSFNFLLVYEWRLGTRAHANQVQEVHTRQGHSRSRTDWVHGPATIQSYCTQCQCSARYAGPLHCMSVCVCVHARFSRWAHSRRHPLPLAVLISNFFFPSHPMARQPF